MNRLLLTTALLPLGFAAMPASAACVSVLPKITCNGFSTGFTNATNGLSVDVEEGATVLRSTSDAIRVRGTGNTVTNNGTIVGAGELPDNGTDGIDGGHNLTVINNGTITATNKGIDAEEKNNLYVVNNGTISAYDKAIRNADGANGSLTNNGLIESEIDEGFESGNNAWVLNNGTIRASDDAIQVGENASIFNYGLIESVLRGGDEDDPQDGIDIDSGVIHNYAKGVIRSDDDAAIDYDESVVTSTINNYGRIEGTIGVLTDPANTATQIIYNYGTLTGTSGVSVDLGFGDDELRLYNGSMLNGDALLGDGADTAYFGAGIFADVTNGVIDGGEGFDTAVFALMGFSELLSVALDGEVMSLTLLSDWADYTVSFRNFDLFRFADGDYTWAELATPAAVPVPAAGLMLFAALGGLVALRRRR